MQRLRALSEEECYLRCYGWVGSDEAVRVLGEDVAPAVAAVVEERLRRDLERRLRLGEAEAA
jgi:hypothetical protein